MAKLYALLVGINEYHPNSGVTNLDGCVHDVQAMEMFIEEHYGEILNPSIKVLLNENATRENIIQNFQSHLINGVKSGDTVLFYYSGHGSTSKTAAAFRKYDPKEQDETLVCYDSRLPGNYDLSDKEIAVLLSRIPDDVHTVVIADSCHSASLTRSVVKEYNLGKKRFTKSRKAESDRPLESYLLEGDNYFSDLLEAGKKVTIPHSKHLLLSACDREEEAMETTDERGLFNSLLLDTLEQNKNITYADLFVKVRLSIKNITDQQTPAIAPKEGFNPNTIFLQKGVQNNHKRHNIKFINGNWRLDYGAIHGLPTAAASVDKLLVGIYSDIGDKKQLTAVKVKKVLLKESILIFDKTEEEETLYGEIQTMASPLLIRLEGKQPAMKTFNELYHKAPSPFLLFDKKTTQANYSLSVGKNELVIKNKAGELIHGIKGSDGHSVAYITDILERIEEWERLAKLENKSSKITDAIEMLFLDTEDENQPRELKGDSITLEYPKAGEDRDEDGDLISNWFEIRAKNTSPKNYYIALFHLSADYQVNTLFACQQLPANSGWRTLDDEHGLVIEQENRSEATDVFKLLVSTESFDDYKFQQDGFEFGKIISPQKAFHAQTRNIKKRKKAEADWCTQTITVHTIRKQNTIGKQDIQFEKEKITIKGHPNFHADVSFAPLKSGARSVHPQAILGDIFKDNNLQLLSLSGSKTRGLGTDTIIRLGEIDGEQEKYLAEQPLEIIINQKLKKEEQIIPVTFDGEFIIPFGITTKEKDGSTKISIHKLPDAKDIHTTRSPQKALWFCLLKAAGWRNKAFRLRIAQINSKGELVRNRSAIQSMVDQAKKIVVVIHGIIGDTEDMAKNLMFLVDEGHYDLMLTFDYENLNEPIEGIAKELNKRLTALGLNANDDKQLDIIAHSMGGLVSRYMMENIREGDTLVNRLIMLGTPNGGSAFGNIPQYIDMLNTLLTVAVNFGKPFIAPAIAYLEGLSTALVATKYVTVTLDQMKEDNPFIENLYKNKNTAAQYYIIAGDITDYESSEDGTFNRFKEKILLKIGDQLNRSTPNDIAVSCAQITAVPPNFITNEVIVSCHHLNYFISEAAMAELRKIYV